MTSREQGVSEDGRVIVIIRYIVYVIGAPAGPVKPSNAVLGDKFKEDLGLSICHQCTTSVVSRVYFSSIKAKHNSLLYCFNKCMND